MKVRLRYAPVTCDICRFVCKDAYVDGRTRLGPWANMCLPCHATHGVGLGTGYGQKYVKSLKTHGPTPLWVKVEG